MSDFDILDRERVFEQKRPYNRYMLKTDVISIAIDLNKQFEEKAEVESVFKIREASNSGAKFTTARNGSFFSSVVLWVGDGRSQKERKIQLTRAQGEFLYHLPFPDAKAKTINQIMSKVGIETVHEKEIIHIVDELISLKIIQKV